MTVRWTNFYLGSKLVSLLTMLKHCSPKWDPETTVVFTDSDVLIQRSASELLSSIKSAGYLTPQFQPDRKRRIVYSTELYNTMNFAADKPMQGRRDKYAESLGRKVSDYPYPYPNSGLFMGYAPDLKAWLEVLIAYRYKEKDAVAPDTTPWDRVHHARGGDAEGLPRVYHQNDQRSLLDMLYRTEETGLDYECTAFQSMYGRGVYQHVELVGGRVHNKKTGRTPTFVHYNGDSKAAGYKGNTDKPELKYQKMFESLRAAGLAQGMEEELSNETIREHVLVLDPDLRPACMADAAKELCGRRL
mmetsp:Transcript_34044/g.78651  ORF Transcript_34044/g.78651 Transcript_34044/m.78651 type:complete len:302 (+) Transcript_34044:1439-2344(+)